MYREARSADVGVSFPDFYRSSRDRLAGALALTLGDVHLGADAVDEAMVRAYQRWDRVGAFDDPAARVYRVALNWATSVLQRRNCAPSLPAEKWVEDTVSVAEPAVAAALAALSVDQRSVIVCRYYLGMSEHEAASALGIRPGTVKSRLHRALRELERRLHHLRPEGP